MSSSLPSDEVAEDYKNSLEDLTTNDKFQISNLTVIAKENTEHAMAISRVLENHINTVGVFLPLLSAVCCRCLLLSPGSSLSLLSTFSESIDFVLYSRPCVFVVLFWGEAILIVAL